MFVDSHCHLDFPSLAEREDEILATMAANDVGTALCISVRLEEFPRVLALAERHAHLWASVGVHPDNADCEEPDLARLLALADHPRVVAIGETGLDYYWHKDAPEWQRERFRVHIRAARATGKPLVIHTRNAAADTLRLMREEGAGEAGGVKRGTAASALAKERSCFSPADRLPPRSQRLAWMPSGRASTMADACTLPMASRTRASGMASS